MQRRELPIHKQHHEHDGVASSHKFILTVCQSGWGWHLYEAEAPPSVFSWKMTTEQHHALIKEKLEHSVLYCSLSKWQPGIPERIPVPGGAES